MTLRFIQCSSVDNFCFLPNIPPLPFGSLLKGIVSCDYMTYSFLYRAMTSCNIMSESRVKSWISFSGFRGRFLLVAEYFFIYSKQTVSLSFKMPCPGPFCGTYSNHSSHLQGWYFCSWCTSKTARFLEYLVVFTVTSQEYKVRVSKNHEKSRGLVTCQLFPKQRKPATLVESSGITDLQPRVTSWFWVKMRLKLWILPPPPYRTLIKKNTKCSSYLRKFGWDRVQSHI